MRRRQGKRRRGLQREGDIMFLELVAGLAALAAIAVTALLWRHYANRARYHKQLAGRRAELTADHEPKLGEVEDGTQFHEAFERDRLIRAENFLNSATLEKLRAESLANTGRVIRSYVPTHKKGGTVSYEKIHYHAPGCLAVYHSPKVRSWISNVVGAPVVPTANHDQSSCSLLVYDQEGDHINWHYDHNFYNGRHFTVLVSLHNRSQQGTVSSSLLQHKAADGRELAEDTSENVIVVFEGARVLHRATQTKAGDLRIMLSMTFATNPTLSWYKEVIRRIKDIAFFGLKILWH
jgi:hypothetical protein